MKGLVGGPSVGGGPGARAPGPPLNPALIRGCCALKFLNALEIDQDYLAHPPRRRGPLNKV